MFVFFVYALYVFVSCIWPVGKPLVSSTCVKLMGVDTGGRETSKCSYISCNIEFIEMEEDD